MQCNQPASDGEIWIMAQQWVSTNQKFIRQISSPFFRFMAGDAEDLYQEATIAAFKAIIATDKKGTPEKFIPFFRVIFRTDCIKLTSGVQTVHCLEDYFLPPPEQQQTLPEPETHEIRQALIHVTKKQRKICLWLLQQPTPANTRDIAREFNVSRRHACRLVNNSIQRISGGFDTMFITHYAKVTSVPGNILRYLNTEGFIEDPLSQDDFLRLQFLERIWGNKKLIRSQLSRLSIKARKSFLRTADLQTKWERYAYSRFFNLESGQKLPMGALIEEVQTTFSFLLSKKQISSLYKIRNRAQVARHRKKNQQEND
jgi:DNA-directed RNA polymerase specialized sigma24 family protein